MGVVNFTPRPLYPQQRTPVSTEQEAGEGGAGSRSVWTLWRGENILLIPGFEHWIYQTEFQVGLQELQAILKKVNPI